MKKLIYLLPFIITFQLNAQLNNIQSDDLEYKRAEHQKNRNALLTRPVPANIQKHFDIAIDEIDQMLKGEKPLSFKRAVYLVENAFCEGKIN